MGVHELAQVFEPWQSLYNDSKVVETIVTSVHLGAMLLGGGLAVAADRLTIAASRGAASERARQLLELSRAHRIVLISIVLMFISGIAMMAADVETFLTSVALWIKLSLVTVLLVNGALMQRQERRLNSPPTAATARVAEQASTAAWSAMRMHAIASITLWFATLVAGVALLNAA